MQCFSQNGWKNGYNFYHGFLAETDESDILELRGTYKQTDKQTDKGTITFLSFHDMKVENDHLIEFFLKKVAFLLNIVVSTNVSINFPKMHNLNLGLTQFTSPINYNGSNEYFI